jgi:hypothetical protein
LAAGADGFMAKPFKDSELFENISRLTGVDYLYQEDGAVEKPLCAEDNEAMRQAASGLPPDVVRRIRDAVVGADMDLLDELVAKLAVDQPVLAQRMHEMAVRYEYEELIELFSRGE